jgi:predicted RNase H-like HicB family nuclease
MPEFPYEFAMKDDIGQVNGVFGIYGNGRSARYCETMKGMKRSFAATVWREGQWYVSQCLEVDVASQGETEQEALSNLKEALELHFEPPRATRPPAIRTVEVEVGAA